MLVRRTWRRVVGEVPRQRSTGRSLVVSGTHKGLHHPTLRGVVATGAAYLGPDSLSFRRS